MAGLCLPLEGKDQAVTRGALPPLTALLADAAPAVRAAAAGALMRCVFISVGMRSCGTLHLQRLCCSLFGGDIQWGVRVCDFSMRACGL